jgi:hypothetical protein
MFDCMSDGPVFFVALAHTDTIATFNDIEGISKSRISNINLFPDRMKENLLFSMSFDSRIHYETLSSQLDPICSNEGLALENRPPKRMFADCGAFQFRELPRPLLGEVELNYNIAWDYYEKKHVQAKHRWNEILLCSPDHIITEDMDDEETQSRYEFIKENAAPFLEKSKCDARVFAVGVIHGRNIEERKKQYEMFKSMGYEYVALGGMVPYSTKQAQVLDIVAGIKDTEAPFINPESILGRCRKDGIKLHIFGLNSPEWVRWWHRLQVDSFDGSKLSTEGAANGWYYIPNDDKGGGRDMPKQPLNVSQLYQRIAVKKMGATDWEWNEHKGLLKPIVPFTEKGVDTTCDCPACQYLKSSRCTSPQCWFKKVEQDKHHVSDPRMMGSTEHNMGRVAHNAFVFSWLIEQIQRLNTLADENEITEENSWLLNWSTIGVSV